MIGPSIPEHLLKGKAKQVEDDESSDDDYGPALPPDMQKNPEPAPEKRVIGPSFPTGPPPADDSDEDDDVGPMPLPEGYVAPETSGLQDFLDQEERRRKAIEEDGKPKAVKREEWMLAPPESSGILGNLDPTKLKPRQFQRNSEQKVTERNLWTETPAERQQRLADEVSGKRKRAEVAAGGSGGAEPSEEDRKRRRRDAEIREQIEEHNKSKRGESLVDMHTKSQASSKKKSDKEEAPPAIWDRDRDMGLKGKLMDEKSRAKLIQDAKGLSSRFGPGKGGSYL
ncbi:hypothetical protein FS837_000198 [Tulasnella sp. UAMH 9824]|nr:hypothetical protein FS837_000198 [Tulasnella sp. UAMH 9824]